MARRWKQMRDCVAGSEAVKAAKTIYLPALAGHLEGRRLTEDYIAYQTRALFYNVTGRTIDGLSGMVFRRPPIVDLPPAADGLIRDVDMMGRRVEDFADAVLREVLTTGRVGVLVDYTRDEDFSQGEIGGNPVAERRPYLALYATENILDVVWERVSGARRLVQVRLAESLEVPGDREFEVRQVQVVRVLELADGVYQQRVFVAEETPGRTTTFAEHPSVIPVGADGRAFDRIPFWVIGTGANPMPGEIEPPPLLDLSDVNLAHYRTDADYRNALHMAGVPTPYCTGMDNPGTEIRFGASEFLWFPQPEAKVGFLSYGAEGVAAIQKALLDLESQAAFLGARMLQPDRPGVEAAETARIHRMGEISILARLSNVISNNLTSAVRVMIAWAGIPSTDEHQVRLNDDFLPTQAPAQLLAEMVKSWQAGAISHDSLWRFMQEGELVDPRRSVEEELAIVEQETPEEPEVEEQELQLEGQRIGVEQQRLTLEQQTEGGQEAA
jgi:hypothetical protein